MISEKNLPQSLQTENYRLFFEKRDLKYDHSRNSCPLHSVLQRSRELNSYYNRNSGYELELRRIILEIQNSRDCIGD